MSALVSRNDLKMLTIERLTLNVKAEHEALKDGIRKLVMDHHEEGHRNNFCQFIHDGTTLKNKDKHQAMGMQFADEDGKYDNDIALAFRKPVSHKADNVATLAKDIILVFFGCEFIDLFCSAV